MSLKRLGPVAAMVLVAGNMIGSGIFMLPATLGTIGSVSLIAWGLASLGALLVALVFSFLAQIRPEADGVVAYAAEGLHPAAGHVSWFAYWLNCWVGTVAVAVAATGYLAYFFPVLKAPGVSTFATLGVIWGLTFINLIGPRVMARYGAATLILGLAPIALATIAGALAFNPEIFAASWNVSGKPDGVVITASVAPIFWAFLGLESAVVAAAVIENPRRNLPIATVGGVLLAAVIYMAASAAIMGLAPASVMARRPPLRRRHQGFRRPHRRQRRGLLRAGQGLGHGGRLGAGHRRDLALGRGGRLPAQDGLGGEPRPQADPGYPGGGGPDERGHHRQRLADPGRPVHDPDQCGGDPVDDPLPALRRGPVEALGRDRGPAPLGRHRRRCPGRRLLRLGDRHLRPRPAHADPADRRPQPGAVGRHAVQGPAQARLTQGHAFAGSGQGPSSRKMGETR
uniref:Arginine/agmatine antiporter n=1 Tax=Phenylobacterium glaciei TaxID=2803784 RepID=A0A974P0M2_9CAUL|nr:amino acid permease [Phenylobacterium glaciei]